MCITANRRANVKFRICLTEAAFITHLFWWMSYKSHMFFKYLSELQSAVLLQRTWRILILWLLMETSSRGNGYCRSTQVTQWERNFMMTMAWNLERWRWCIRIVTSVTVVSLSLGQKWWNSHMKYVSAFLVTTRGE